MMKRNALKTSMVLLFLLLLFFNSYGQEKAEWKGKVEVENDVRVVKNPKEPLYGEIIFELEEDLSIGNNEDENYMFYGGLDIKVDSYGNIFVLDRGNFRIQKFDREGKFLQSIGRKGQGPGEFENSFNLDIMLDSENNIYVRDGYQIHRFNEKGNFIKSILFSQPILQFEILKNGNLMAQTMAIAGNMKTANVPEWKEFIFNIDLINPEGKLLKTIASFRQPRNLPLQIGGRRSYLNNKCAASLVFCVIEGELGIYGYSSDYTLYIVNSLGEVQLIIKKDELPHKLSNIEKARVINKYIENQKKIGREVPIGKVSRAFNFPKYTPFFSWMLKDDRRRIYVERFKLSQDTAKEFEYDVFNVNGIHLYRLKMPFRPIIIKEGYLFSIRIDPPEYCPQVKRYKINNWGDLIS